MKKKKTAQTAHRKLPAFTSGRSLSAYIGIAHRQWKDNHRARLAEHRLRKPSLEHPRGQDINAESRYETHDRVYQVMCLDIDRSPAQQQIERKQAGKQTLAATPCHNHQYRRHSDVRTGKSSRGALTHLLGTLHQVVEEAVLIARTGKKFLMVMEIVTDGRKDTLRHMVASNGGEVELRPGNGDEDINKVIDEESGDDDERNLLEKVRNDKGNTTPPPAESSDNRRSTPY